MTIYIWAEKLRDLLLLSAVVPVCLGLVRWRSLTRSEKWVVLFLGAMLLHELLVSLPVYINRRNHYLYYIQTVLVLITVAGVYADTISPKPFVWQLAVLLSVVMVAEVRFWTGFNHINSATLTASRLLAAAYALVSLNRIFLASTPAPRNSTSMIYMHLGFFLFGAFTAINTYFKSYFIENSLNLYYLFDTLSAMISAIAFVLFSVGFSQVRAVGRPQPLP